jgi:mRNA-degrading endonuclease RelE of RelBE toxin-antitoxin system
VAWEIIFSFRVEEDVAAAALWYEAERAGLGHKFLDEVIRVWRQLALNPLLAARKHRTKNLRWRYPERFPYRIIYEVDEERRTVLVLRVVHAAREDSTWRG